MDVCIRERKKLSVVIDTAELSSVVSNTLHLIFKGIVSRNFVHCFFHDSNSSGPKNYGLKQLYIHYYICTVLVKVQGFEVISEFFFNHTDSSVSLTPPSFYDTVESILIFVMTCGRS